MTGFDELIERCVEIADKHEKAQRSTIENAIQRAGLWKREQPAVELEKEKQK